MDESLSVEIAAVGAEYLALSALADDAETSAEFRRHAIRCDRWALAARRIELALDEYVRNAREEAELAERRARAEQNPGRGPSLPANRPSTAAGASDPGRGISLRTIDQVIAAAHGERVIEFRRPALRMTWRRYGAGGMSDLITIRASSLSSYADCPRRAAARMFRREIEAAGFALREMPLGIGAAIGTAVHSAAALTLREKAATGSVAPLDTVTDCAVESVREAAAEGVMFDRDTADRNTAERQSARMAAAYQGSVAPVLEPVLIEERLEAETPFGVVLTGHADLVAREPGAIDDLKTSTRMRGAHTPQIGSYSLLARSNGLDIERARIDHLRRVSLKKEQPPVLTQIVNVVIAETAAVAVLQHIARSLDLWRNGDPEHRMLPGSPEAFLCNAASMLCGPKYCSAFASDWCREGAEAHPEKESD